MASAPRSCRHNSMAMQKRSFLMLLCAFPMETLCAFVRATERDSVRVMGRFLVSSDDTILFDWSAVTVTASLHGSEFSVVLSDRGNLYNVSVDGMAHGILSTTSKPNASYLLASGLAPDNHIIKLIKRTEGGGGIHATRGAVELHGFVASGRGGPLPRCRGRRLLFIGDSISCGYGALGTRGCQNPELESATVAFSARTAAALEAEYHLLCYSGKGLVRNFGQRRAEWHHQTMPTIWQRTLASRVGDPWNVSSWVPHAIVIHLGTNDYNNHEGPSHREFVTTYRHFISEVRKDLGMVPVVLACGPMCRNCPVCDYVAAVAAGGHSISFADLRIDESNTSIACWGHPSAAGHQHMSEILVPLVAAAAGWQAPDSTNPISTVATGWQAQPSSNLDLTVFTMSFVAISLAAGMLLCRCCSAAAPVATVFGILE